MARSEAVKRAQARYAKRNAGNGATKGFYLKCHSIHDKDVIDALAAQENVNGYIKELIRKDIEKI